MRFHVSTANELLRGSVWSSSYLEEDQPEPVVIVSNDGRNRSRFEWVSYASRRDRNDPCRPSWNSATVTHHSQAGR